MKVLTRKLSVLRIAVMALIVAMAMPVTSLAQGQGRGRGRGRDFDKLEKKCGKFINCHDARDGRWDGRGPNRTRFDDRFRRRRFRNRDLYDDDFRRLQRRRFRNRDFDDDDFRRLQRMRYRNYRYQSDGYYTNPSGYQRGFNWTDILNLFLQ
jgi:hypothetical protein